MKKMVFIFGLWVACIGNVLAANFTDYLYILRGKSDVVYYRKANSIIGSDGSAFQINGNSIFSNDGVAYQVNGDFVYSNYGVIYQIRGDSLWGSNGKVYETRGSHVFGTDGLMCFFDGNKKGGKKGEKMIFCK